jgi:chemotaxis protein methyltransferase CheR
VLSNALISQLNEHLLAHTGLFFPEKRWDEIRQKMTAAMTDFGFEDAEEFIHWLLSAPLTTHQIETLARHLTVQETYFFRESKTFEVLEHTILPELINSRRNAEKRIRIWSAGCSTGEEPYSIAILLNKLIPDIKNWSITILATDINPDGIQKARQGIYTEWSFRDTPQWVIEQYFEKIKHGHYAIHPPIKEMVTFSYINLVEDLYPSLSNQTNAMDVIFCRNVLMYFAEESAKKVMHNLSRSLVDKGWMFISPVERIYVQSPLFTAVHFPDAIIYRKDRDRRKAEEIHYAFPSIPREEVQFPAAGICIDASPKQDVVPMVFETKILIQPDNNEKKTEETYPSYVKARAFYEQGLYGEATQELLELVSLNKDIIQVLPLLARSYANQGNLPDALKWCEKAIDFDKLSPGLYYLRATILQEQGSMEEAVRSLKSALYLDPDFVLAHFAMGVLNKQCGKFKVARKHFENVITLLHHCQQEDILPESDGVTAGRLGEIIGLMKQEKNPYA